MFSTTVTAFIFMYESMRKSLNELEASSISLVSYIKSAILVSVMGAVVITAVGLSGNPGADTFVNVLSIATIFFDFLIIIVTIFFDHFTAFIACTYVKKKCHRGDNQNVVGSVHTSKSENGHNSSTDAQESVEDKERSGGTKVADSSENPRMHPIDIINRFEPMNQLIWSILNGTAYFAKDNEQEVLCEHFSKGVWSVVRGLKSRCRMSFKPESVDSERSESDPRYDCIRHYLDRDTRDYVDSLYEGCISGKMTVEKAFSDADRQRAVGSVQDYPDRTGIIPLWDCWTKSYLDALEVLTGYITSKDGDRTLLHGIVKAYYDSSEIASRLREASEHPQWRKSKRCVKFVQNLDSVMKPSMDFRKLLFNNSFRDVNLSGADLRETSFYECLFEGCSFVSANIGESDMTDARLIDCDLQALDLGEGVLLTGTEFRRCSFGRFTVDSKSDMTSCRMMESVLVRASFCHTQMRSVRFDSMEIHRTSFRAIDMTDAAVDRTIMDRCIFEGDRADRSDSSSGSDNNRCRMDGLSLTNSKIQHSEICDCSLNNAYLDTIDLTGTQLRHVMAVDNRVVGLRLWNNTRTEVLDLTSENCAISDAAIKGIKLNLCNIQDCRIERSEIKDVEISDSAVTCHISDSTVTNVKVIESRGKPMRITLTGCRIDTTVSGQAGFICINCRYIDT